VRRERASLELGAGREEPRCRSPRGRRRHACPQALSTALCSP